MSTVTLELPSLSLLQVTGQMGRDAGHLSKGVQKQAEDSCGLPGCLSKVERM